MIRCSAAIDALLVAYWRHEDQEPVPREYPCQRCDGTGTDPHGRDWVTNSYYQCDWCGGDGVDAAEHQRAHSAWAWERHEMDEEFGRLEAEREAVEERVA